MHKVEAIAKQYYKSISEYMETALPPYSPHTPRLEEAMLYSLLPAGKIIRPLLVLSSYKLFSHSHNEAVPMAVSVEMLHTYSLVHDDLPCMDNDSMRRGRSSTHAIYGDWMATLTGDALLTKAFEIMSSSPTFSSQVRLNAITKMAQYAGHTGLIAGQVADMSYTPEGVSSMDIHSKQSLLEFIHTNKTAALFRYSCELGGILSEASPQDTAAMALFGEKMGLAFQIYDDINDSDSSEDHSKLTYPALIGIEDSRRVCKRVSDDALKILDRFSSPQYNSEACQDLMTLAESISQPQPA